MTISEAPIPLGDKRAPDPICGEMTLLNNVHTGFRFYRRPRDGTLIYGYPKWVSVFGVNEADKLKDIAKEDSSKFVTVNLTLGGTVGLSCMDLAAADAAEEILKRDGFFKQDP